MTKIEVFKLVMLKMIVTIINLKETKKIAMITIIIIMMLLKKTIVTKKRMTIRKKIRKNFSRIIWKTIKINNSCRQKRLKKLKFSEIKLVWEIFSQIILIINQI